MKKEVVVGVAAIVLIVFFIPIVFAEIKLNEIELNPSGVDAGSEWIELYSNADVNLSGWKIINSKGEDYNLSGTFNGYFVVTFDRQFLNNQNESVKLYNGDNLVDSSIELNDNYNDARTWSLCSSTWKFVSSSKGLVNNYCPTNNNSNNNNTPVTSPTPRPSATKPPIILELEWNEDDIVSTDEFNIKVKVYNLEDKSYDIKVWIYEEEDKAMTQFKNSKDDWETSNNYYKQLFSGPGDKNDNIKIKFKGGFKDSSGSYKLKARIRESNSSSSSYLKETLRTIWVIKGDIVTNESDNQGPGTLENDPQVKKVMEDMKKSDLSEEEVIRLGPAAKTTNPGTESIKTKKNVNYESKDDKIFRYSIFGFLGLCFVTGVFLVIRKKPKENLE